MATKKPPSSKSQSFEDKMKFLEDVAKKLENPDTKLADSLKQYEKAMTVVKECEEELEKANLLIEKVSKVDAEGEEWEEETWDHEEDSDED